MADSTKLERLSKVSSAYLCFYSNSKIIPRFMSKLHQCVGIITEHSFWFTIPICYLVFLLFEWAHLSLSGDATYICNVRDIMFTCLLCFRLALESSFFFLFFFFSLKHLEYPRSLVSAAALHWLSLVYLALLEWSCPSVSLRWWVECVGCAHICLEAR